jgi:hypothetical protein
VSSVGFPSGRNALYIASRLMPASRAISVIPRARATSPRAAAMSAGSPSSKAASSYSLTSSAVDRCSVGAQVSVSRAISVFLQWFQRAHQCGASLIYKLSIWSMATASDFMA